ncbi:hypothetical protein TNCV_1717911 [Trichonephila clavipes]|nr:hypothetical protein TNCV_1717911 [Trichonephila clavipes]
MELEQKELIALKPFGRKNGTLIYKGSPPLAYIIYHTVLISHQVFPALKKNLAGRRFEAALKLNKPLKASSQSPEFFLGGDFEAYQAVLTFIHNSDQSRQGNLLSDSPRRLNISERNKHAEEYKAFKKIYRAMGSLVVRVTDYSPEGLGSKPPNTLQVHTRVHAR